MKKILLILTVVALSFGLLLAQTANPDDTVVAEVNGTIITMQQLNEEANVERLLFEIRSIDERFYQVLVNTSEGMNVLLRYKREVLNNLIDQVLIVQMAEKMGVAPKKEEIENLVNEELNRTLSTYGITESDLDWYLRISGLGTLETFKNRLRRIFTVQKSVEAIQNAVTSVEISKSEVEDYYNKNKEEFALQEAVKALRIIVGSKAEADNVLARLRAGEDFQKIAAEVSIDPLSKDRAGDLGWVERNSYFINKEIEEKLFASPVNAILGPFETAGGWEIYRVMDKRSKTYLPLEEVYQDIVDMLKEAKAQELWLKWISEDFKAFKESSDIKIYLLVEEGQKNQ
ncbi:peptidyl-prolyl cis-trans isomerase [Pseudothermotoga thermarum]|uniref:PpiC-type peptidyl-prolyl cis-trans isomerase n=1 Tax=Pseudothermotoga thermarum DSM 5069 TaxID=688269 RepID=F7YX47_9THEM|nr:peptidyl-prolyl cis-trans isomerase [Pseudothermotoga thermarum]AEH50859.1 PpiC-type peptidyl-prolyl cis-trans isomerase [Pseudothermotoga thermarum DSM 5069]